MLEHVPRDVPGDIHDRLLTSAALCKIGDKRMTVIVPAARHLGVPSHRIRNECGYDLLQAMNTGHGGTLSTIHAKSAWDALNRLSNLALSARPNLNHAFIRAETAEAIDFVLYCERDHAGRRRVRELITVSGYSHADQSFQTEQVYRASAA